MILYDNHLSNMGHLPILAKGKQYRHKPDATERVVWSGSPLFASRMVP